jgi:hypothetical protein
MRGINLRTRDIVLAYVTQLGDPPPLLEVIPIGDDAAYCTIFTFGRQLVQPASLDALFKAHCRHNPFFQLTPLTEYTSGKVGVIPIGRVRSRTLRGVVSLGEAGLIQPPLLGTAFNEILEYSDHLCKQISGALDTSSPLVPFSFPLLKRTQDRLQLAIARLMLRGNVEVFDNLVRYMGRLPAKVFYDLCSNELTWTDLLRATLSLPRCLVGSRLNEGQERA